MPGWPVNALPVAASQGRGLIVILTQVTNPVSSGGAEVASIQAAMMAVQECMQRHSGSFLQFRCDEKGFVSICAFGLPGNAHEDDPCRGVHAALDLVEALQEGVRAIPHHTLDRASAAHTWCLRPDRQSSDVMPGMPRFWQSRIDKLSDTMFYVRQCVTWASAGMGTGLPMEA